MGYAASRVYVSCFKNGIYIMNGARRAENQMWQDTSTGLGKTRQAVAQRSPPPSGNLARLPYTATRVANDFARFRAFKIERGA